MIEPWLDDGDVRLYQGDALEVLAQLPAESAQTCVTSPPYYGLRDYGTGEWQGGSSECDHLERAGAAQNLAASAASTRGGGHKAAQTPPLPYLGEACKRCGARRVDAQIGLEESPEAYVERLVAVFDQVRRVLRDDGTLWLNLGDSYASNAATARGGAGESYRGDGPTLNNENQCRVSYRGNGIKSKDLLGIPWRVAFALQSAGWYLRADVIWSKPNPMPESVTDRPTKAHEYLFLLAKRPRYYYDADAIREAPSGRRDPYAVGPRAMDGRPFGQSGQSRDTPRDPERGANKRSVWTVPTAPYPGAHFAVFPPALIEPCILAGAPEGGVVLDPFSGSGTTAQTARRLNRRAVGVELNPAYLKLAGDRLAQLSLLAT